MALRTNMVEDEGDWCTHVLDTLAYAANAARQNRGGRQINPASVR